METCIDLVETVRHLIGTRFIESVKPYVMEMTGAKSVVVTDGLLTADYHPDRLVITIDKLGIITGMHMG